MPNPSLLKLIQKGKSDNVWKSIRSFDDLLIANVAFLEGKLQQTPYHFGPIFTETTSIVMDLIRLHTGHRMVTINSQPAACDKEHFIKDTWTDPQTGEIQGNWFTQSQQRSYLEALVEASTYDRWLTQLEKHSSQIMYVITDIKAAKRRYHSNFEQPRFLVTQSKEYKRKSQAKNAPWREITFLGKSFESATGLLSNMLRMKNIASILKKCSVIVVAARKFCDIEVKDILLQS